MTTTVTCAVVVIGLLLAGCSADGGARDDGDDVQGATPTDLVETDGDDDEEYFVFTDEERAELQACTVEKLDDVPDDLDVLAAQDDLFTRGESDPEAAWEGQRLGRAYTQCVIDLHSDRYDFTDPEIEGLVRFAYALDPDGNPMMTDPLAPWAERDR